MFMTARYTQKVEPTLKGAKDSKVSPIREGWVVAPDNGKPMQ
jgi:hypothetical protein